jgi:hypothetical protein
MTPTLPISPLSLADLVRDLWGNYDAAAIAQLAPLAYESCYQPKFYKAPDLQNEVFAANSYYPYGLKITPGSIIYGIHLPASLSTSQAPRFNVQVTDVSLNHQWWDEPLPVVFSRELPPVVPVGARLPGGWRDGVFP